MKTFTIYLKSGQQFTLRAEKVICKYNTLTGKLLSLRYENGQEGTPLYLDIPQVEAVVQEKIGD